MPIDAIALPAVLALVEGYLLDQEEKVPPWPESAGQGGLSDEDLWAAVVSGGDVLHGMSFDAAVIQDPRRIDALVHQRVTSRFYSALSYLQHGAWPGGRTLDDLLKHAYLLQMKAARELYGAVTAEALADVFEDNWTGYSKVLEISIPMRRKGMPAEKFWDAVLGNAHAIATSFREAHEIVLRAAGACEAESDQAAAWERIAACVQNMSNVLFTHLAAVFPPVLAVESGGEGLPPPVEVPGEEEEGEMRALPVPGPEGPVIAPESEGEPVPVGDSEGEESMGSFDETFDAMGHRDVRDVRGWRAGGGRLW